MNLTGNTRYRSNWLGKLILQVEYTYEESGCYDMDWRTVILWRDAKVEDLTGIKVFLSNQNDQ